MFEHKIVKIIKDDDGNTKLNRKWCYAIDLDGTLRTICGGECFGFGEGISESITKEVGTQKVNCNRCNLIINHFKKLKI